MSPRRLRRIALCADDFGLDAAINEACLDLADAGRLSALSCMSTAPAWAAGAAALRQRFDTTLDLGLHLNLTEAVAPGHWRRPLTPLIASAYLNLLPVARLHAEMAAQFDAFEAALGRPPDFVDGHQHVHQLPQVRELLIETLLRRYPMRRPWLRRTGPPALRLSGGADARKQRGIAALGAQALSAQAAEYGFPQNRGFVGVYDFGGSDADYAARMANWCTEIDDGGLLMCHPAIRARAGDPIGAARLREYALLRGEAFGELLRAQGLVVGRLSQTLRA